jgi:acyl-CoA synthetase (AMP-forming)/AMP-acid ligase II
MKYFWIDPKRNMSVSYEDLFIEITKTTSVQTVIRESDPSEVFKHLIIAMFYDVNVTILDADFSEKELFELGINSDDLSNSVTVENATINNGNKFEELLKKSNSEVEIFTSGTTGRPKSIKQTYRNLTRQVKVKNEYKDNIWGFSYNSSHFAGLQVFFQGFLNKNTFVYLFDKSPDEVPKLIQEFNITHLSFTPTFCRQIIPYISDPILSVTNLTFGGEKFDSKLSNKIETLFPNAKIRNVYASTEAGSIFATNGEDFHIPHRLKPFVKINENNELLIHKDLLGKSDKILNSEGDWYATGDIVEFIDTDRFRFKHRKSEMVNIGGYKVNPSEVENIIKKHDKVDDVIIASRPNSVLGNILVAQIVTTEKDFNETTLKSEILSFCKANLQSWKVPRQIKFVEKFELTRTGKLKRI